MWSSSSRVTTVKIGGKWVRKQAVVACEIGYTGIDVHLESGARITLPLERTAEALDRVANALCGEEAEGES